MMIRTSLVAAAVVCLVALPVAAGNGHTIHGVGPVNSSMGGAGVGLPVDVVGALWANPALLTRLEGENNLAFSVEMAAAGIDTESSVQTPFGPFGGKTEDDTDPAAIPAFGWSHHKSGSKMAFGFGFLGLAGFQTDYPQDPTNPVFAPQPQGLGRSYSEYQFAKIPIALAWQLNPNFSLGLALNVDRATLSGSPFAPAAPDCTSPVDCYFPGADSQSVAMGYGFQIGVYHEVTPKFSWGAAYTSEQDFEDFQWNSTVANPNLPNFGAARSFDFKVNGPASLAVGIGLRPTSNLAIALDVKQIYFSSADGLGDEGFNPDGSVEGFGWEDSTVFALGIQWQATPKLALRAGFNRAESAVPDSNALFAVIAPAIFEDHITVGAGFPITSKATLNVAYYRAFDNEVTGPILTPAGPVPGSSVTVTNSISSVLFGIAFEF